MSKSFSPKYLKAKVSFTYGDKNFDLGEKMINMSGVERIEWSHADPREMVGQSTQVKVEVIAKQKFAFECRANFTCDQNELLVYLGLAFALPPEVEQMLGKIIDEEGILPEYIRKFPRVMFSRGINVMPELAIISCVIGDNDIASACKVVNLSPSGFRLTSEDSRLMSILPGTEIEAQLTPRGSFSNAIDIQAVVRSVSQSNAPDTGNLVWGLGLEITGIQEPDRSYFKDLLKMIVESIQRQ